MCAMQVVGRGRWLAELERRTVDIGCCVRCGVGVVVSWDADPEVKLDLHCVDASISLQRTAPATLKAAGGPVDTLELVGMSTQTPRCRVNQR